MSHLTFLFTINKFLKLYLSLAPRNKYDALQEKTETHTPNEECENLVNAHLEVAAEFIPTKQKTKSRVPWETFAVREKRADVKTASKCNRKNPTNTNALKLKKAQNELACCRADKYVDPAIDLSLMSASSDNQRQ